MLRVKSVYLLPLVCALTLTSLPGWAQSTGVGKRGLYGKNSIDPEAPAATKPAAAAPAAKPGTAPAAKPGTATDKKEPELTDEQKRLLQKYPLSTTPKTTTNQNAHNFLLKGILLYKQTRDLFAAANDIKSTYTPANSLLEVTQKGIVEARLQPGDLLLYGPEYAYISLRLRALQDADRTIAASTASFRQAQALAPSLSLIPKWIRVTQDTQKAIRYHIRFYQLSLKAVNLGYTEKELKYMAARWNGPVLDNPLATLTTRVNTQLFEQTRGKPDPNAPTVKRPTLDAFVTQLPNLDFKVTN